MKTHSQKLLPLQWKLSALLRRRRKEHFIQQLPARAVFIDVGCGNQSPLKIKGFRPDLTYIGIDVEDHNQTPASKTAADQLVTVPPENFDRAIAGFAGQADAVLSAHNIEHCNEPEKVVKAMCLALRPGGRLYMSFPSEASIRFPQRPGTLNFYDDATHKTVLSLDLLLEQLRAEGMVIEYARRRYRPLLYALAGALLEPWSRFRNRVMHPFTWSFYGFESIVWARKE